MNDDNNKYEGVMGNFSTPFAFYFNDNLTAGLKDYILEQSVDGIESGVATSIKHGIIESDFNLVNKNDSRIKDVFNWISDKICMTVNTVNGKQDCLQVGIRESWYHITKTNGMHNAHIHTGCSWCGIYYVDAGDEGSGGETVFINPIVSTFKDVGTNYYSNMAQLHITPQQGKLVLFPSYLTHYQSPYTGSKDRIVIAFNSTVRIADTDKGPTFSTYKFDWDKTE